MKRILLTALAVLLPVSALAAPDNKDVVGGKVVVIRAACFRAPCPKLVSIQGKSGDRIAVRGDLANDLAAYEGKIVTTYGTGVEAGAYVAEGFRPGKISEFVTGEVVNITPSSVNARFRPQVAIRGADGLLVKVMDDDLAHSLISLVGSTVTIPGNVVETQGCLPSAVQPNCHGNELRLFPNKGANIFVKGEVEKLAHGMNGQTHILHGADGKTMLVSSSKIPADRDGSSLWLSGKFTTERISGATMFKATSSSKGVVPAEIDHTCLSCRPHPTADGSNVSRASDTDGAAVGQAAPAGNGAGTAR